MEGVERSPLYARAVTVPSYVHVREVDDELVILSLESEEYFGLDPVGARLWQLLRSQPSIGDVVDVMLEEYDIDATTLTRDVERLLDDLASRKLVEIVAAPAGHPHP